MADFGSKKRRSNRRHEFTAVEKHRKWTNAVFEDSYFKLDSSGEPNHIPFRFFRRYAPSRKEKRLHKKRERFGKDLTALFENLDPMLQWEFSDLERKWSADYRAHMTFSDYLLKRRPTTGRVRVIPSSLALLILAGFVLHDGNKDESDGLELIRSFFERDGDFSRWINRSILEKQDALLLMKALCGKDNQKSLAKWKKNFRDRAFENVRVAGDDLNKTNKERARKGQPQFKNVLRDETQIEAANRTIKVKKLVQKLVRSILSSHEDRAPEPQ